MTTVGFGAWAAGGGDWAYSWGPQDDDSSIAAMRRAVELGVNRTTRPRCTARVTPRGLSGASSRNCSPLHALTYSRSAAWSGRKGNRTAEPRRLL